MSLGIISKSKIKRKRTSLTLDYNKNIKDIRNFKEKINYITWIPVSLLRNSSKSCMQDAFINKSILARYIS